MTNFLIRDTTPDDLAQILALYPRAFPEEDLRPVVSALLEDESAVLSLAGFDADVLVSHVIFTRCATQPQDRAGALLGPLGVMPSYQQQGYGNALVRAGLDRLADSGTRQVFVLGDPGYYQRFGFAPESRVQTPFPIPADWAGAWQSMPLAMRTPLAAGPLLLAAPWMEAALWGP